jgi:hypothetical protein
MTSKATTNGASRRFEIAAPDELLVVVVSCERPASWGMMLRQIQKDCVDKILAIHPSQAPHKYVPDRFGDLVAVPTVGANEYWIQKAVAILFAAAIEIECRRDGGRSDAGIRSAAEAITRGKISRLREIGWRWISHFVSDGTWDSLPEKDMAELEQEVGKVCRFEIAPPST